MDNVQIIKSPKGEKMVVLPLKEYDELIAFVEAEEDARDIREAEEILARIKSGKEPLIPMEVVEDIISNGKSTVRAWRDYRKMTAEKLAAKAGITRAYLTQIETGKRKGTLAVHKALAKALRTSVDALVD